MIKSVIRKCMGCNIYLLIFLKVGMTNNNKFLIIRLIKDLRIMIKKVIFKKK